MKCNGGADDDGDEMMLLYENSWRGSTDNADHTGLSTIAVGKVRVSVRLPSFSHHAGYLDLLNAAYQQGKQHAISDVRLAVVDAINRVERT